jgi:hypothetical protein
MSVTEDRNRKTEEKAQMLRLNVQKARELKKQGRSNTSIADAMGLPESSVIALLLAPVRTED